MLHAVSICIQWIVFFQKFMFLRKTRTSANPFILCLVSVYCLGIFSYRPHSWRSCVLVISFYYWHWSVIGKYYYWFGSLARHAGEQNVHRSTVSRCKCTGAWSCANKPRPWFELLLLQHNAEWLKFEIGFRNSFRNQTQSSWQHC